LARQRENSQAGIAIGAILFVIALLAILAVAIVASSSTFSGNAAQETNRANAGAVMQIGQSLKIGISRITLLGTPLADIGVDINNVADNTSLFSPASGMVLPSHSLAADPVNDEWIFNWGAVNHLGDAAPERIASLRISQGLCDQVNVFNNNGATPSLDVGAIDNNTNFTGFPAALDGKQQGCLENTNATTAGYYFYQVLGIQ
jgi:type II secretory pathway pseudopilin PulG